MNRAPLALCFIRHLMEWRAAQTADQCRGHAYEAVILCREASPDEVANLAAGLTSPKIFTTLGSLGDLEEKLKHWGIPSPVSRHVPVTQSTIAGFPPRTSNPPTS